MYILRTVYNHAMDSFDNLSYNTCSTTSLLCILNEGILSGNFHSDPIHTLQNFLSAVKIKGC